MSSELDRVCDALAVGARAGGVPVLATLLRVDGSAYRGPGARMVVLPGDTTVGAISGGCLEKDVAAHAAGLRGGAASRVVTWDLTRDDDAPWGLGMGCQARLDVLLEPCPAGVPDYLAFTQAALARREAVVIATLVAAPAGASPAPGARCVMAGNDGAIAGALVEGPLGGSVRTDAHRVMDEEWSDVAEYEGEKGERGERGEGVVVAFEFVPRPIQLVICGEGNDTAPLARLGAELGWQVLQVGRDDALPALDSRTAVAIMTHNYPRDLALLRPLLASRARYVGLLGPRSRASRLLAELAAAGHTPSPLALEKFHAPVGLDVGAETPEEVALAVAAEARAVMGARPGGKLRERRGPIHDRR